MKYFPRKVLLAVLVGLELLLTTKANLVITISENTVSGNVDMIDTSFLNTAGSTPLGTSSTVDNDRIIGGGAPGSGSGTVYEAATTA
eukprot:CAMPEP_0168775304 /NCGR_PEP_ID=MMETSP0725-20121227/5446_1 /TAXON_ID=265536 /ORGANISM="Amphiprora sp., Strain CCMP467" /LENGTH=86 /DNA_ID=CAMNT_0008824935 /DNA_START=288 /DNA_END=544 /DNA_ORIENTATION=-